MLDQAENSARTQHAPDFASERPPVGRWDVMIYADRGYHVEFGVVKGNLQGVFLNPGFDSRDLRDLPHHFCGNIAPRNVLEVGLKQPE